MMSSRAKIITKTRERLLSIFKNYLYVARGIDDLDKEGDYDDLEDAVDRVLKLVVTKES